jgi:uncharacterized protein (DUF433 family)
MNQGPIHRDKDIMSGTPVFMGTRVPVSILFDYIEGNHSLEYFLEQYPTVSRTQALAVLESARTALLHESAA